uniref:Uncharacterized protein n=1 Tax=Anguilla anguilla TaxID=7936 RepID=A0A0E9UEZ0_ANGAN
MNIHSRSMEQAIWSLYRTSVRDSKGSRSV